MMKLLSCRYTGRPPACSVRPGARKYLREYHMVNWMAQKAA